MIWESSYWKTEIAKTIRFLNKKACQKRWSPTDDFQIEKHLFFSAFTIRKLIEAKTKLSDVIENQKVTVKVFCQKKEVSQPDLLNWHKLEEFYSFENPHQESMSLEDFCNQLIHSYIFIPTTTEDFRALAGIYLASDKEKKKGKLYLIDIDEIICILKSVRDDDICSFCFDRNAKTGEWTIKHKTGYRDE